MCTATASTTTSSTSTKASLFDGNTKRNGEVDPNNDSISTNTPTQTGLSMKLSEISYNVHSVNITQKLITKCVITPSFINSCSNCHISKNRICLIKLLQIFSVHVLNFCVKLKMITFYFWRHCYKKLMPFNPFIT